MMSYLRKPVAFLIRDVREEASYKLAFIMRTAGVFLATFTFFFLSKLIGKATVPYLTAYGGDYFSFVLIGIAFSGYHQVALSGFSRRIREAQMKGTLEAVLLTQTGIPTIIFCSALYPLLWTTLSVVLYFVVGIVILGAKISSGNVPGAFLILLLTITSFCGIGIMSASFVMVFKKGDPLAVIVSATSFLLGGVYYPIAVLPDWLQKVSYFLPIRHSLEGMRLCLLGQASFRTIVPSILALTVLTAILLPLGFLSFQYAVRRAKIAGSLAHY